MKKFCVAILLLINKGSFAQGDPCKPIITIATASTSVCTGTTATFNATIVNEGAAGSYSWKKNNQTITAANAAACTITDLKDGDNISCEYGCKTACGRDTIITSNVLTMLVPNAIQPSIAVNNTDPLICEGQVTSFTATATYGSAVPAYQWYVNDTAVGLNSTLYATNTLTNGSKVECVVTISSPGCPGFSNTASNHMTIYVYPMLHPAIQIKADKATICKGETVTFTAKANGGDYPLFAWELNGVRTGDSAAQFTSSNLKDGDVISCTVTVGIDSRCKSDTISAPSNPIMIRVKDFPLPSVSITSPNLNVCENEPVTFTATRENPGYFERYEWYVNGKKAGDNRPVFTSNQFKNGDTVHCRFATDVVGCSYTFDLTSNAKKVTVRPRPVISFPPQDLVIKAGEQAQLIPSITGKAASILWSPAVLLNAANILTPLTIPLYDDTSFTITVRDTNGCSSSGKILVQILHQLYLPTAFTPNGDGRNEVFKIPEIATIQLKEFSVYNRSGQRVFTTTKRSQGWDGTYHGEPLDPGTYVYFIRGIIDKKLSSFKGTVLLLR